MRFPTTLLWVSCVLFVVFGAGFIVAPQFFASLFTGSIPSTASALIDMRAMYGGMSLGAGLFFGLCARQPSIVWLGLLASLLILAGTAGGRLVGMFVDSSPNIYMFIILAAELLGVVLIVLALRGLKDKQVF